MGEWRTATTQDWPELSNALAAADIEPAHGDVLLRHVAEYLVGWFGVERFEAYRGKEGQQIHSVEEMAAVIVASLAPALGKIARSDLDELSESGELGAVLRHPWDMTS